MARLKFVPFGSFFFCALTILQGMRGTASAASVELLLPLILNIGPGGNNQSATESSISERIHSSLSNVLRIPLLPWGSDSNGTQSGLSLPGQTVFAAVVEPLNAIGDTINLGGQSQQPASQDSPPTSFLPDVNQAIHSTIQQLNVLSHWPFPYETTISPRTNEPTPPPVLFHSIANPTKRATTTLPPPPPTTTTRRTTTTTTTTQAPTTPAPTQALPPPPPPLPPFSLPPPPARPAPTQSLIFTRPTSPPAPSLPDRIHNRIQSTLGHIRLPSLSNFGQRPRPMLTEPPWVTELLGPTLEPPTTRMPTLGERVHNAVSNVVLFVPATLLNFWYENWGTQHVDRFVSRLQVSTPKPGSPVNPVFATVAQNHPNNPFANFTTDRLNSSSVLPSIAAFINNNGTLTPTIVHPVVNMTANTIEYLLRGENETTVLWSGSLSNDVFFGNKKKENEQYIESEDDEDDQRKNRFSTLNLNTYLSK